MGATPSHLPPLKPVSTVVDLPRFMGTWYVVGVKPTFLEVGAVNPVEVYSWNEAERRVDIDFSFNPHSRDNPKRSVPQKGFIHDTKTNAEWRVSPFWPLKLPYLIIELDQSEGSHPYKYTVIGYPSRAYVWIMARLGSSDRTALG